MIKLANAPCSWGTLEFEGMGGGQVPYRRMLAEWFVRAVDDPDDDDARGQMLLAAAYAGIGFGTAGVHLPLEFREQIYEELAPQVEALISDEPDLIANLANIAAVLKEAFGFFWVGFYLAKDGQLHRCKLQPCRRQLS